MDKTSQRNRWRTLALIISYAIFAGSSFTYFHESIVEMVGDIPGVSRWVYLIDGVYIALTLLLVALLGAWLLRLIYSYETALQQSEARFRGIVESTPDMIWETNAQFAYTFVSPMSERLLDCHPDEMLGKTPFDFMPEAMRDRFRALYGHHAQERLPIRFLEVQYAQGGIGNTMVEVSAMPVFDAEGNLIGYHGIDRDVTERKQAESAMLRANEFYRTLFDRMPLPLWRTDVDGHIRYLNPAALDLLSLSQDEVGDYTETIHPVDREQYRADYQRAVATRTRFSLTYRLQRGAGYVRVTSVGVPCWGSEGTFWGFIGYFHEDERSRVFVTA